jgi:RHS repeat-associated protein
VRRRSSGPRRSGSEACSAESGNDYFGARYYASSMGRFLSPDFNDRRDYLDPVPYAKVEEPQTLNLYGYAGNNPLANKDEDGHFYNGLQDPNCGCWPGQPNYDEIEFQIEEFLNSLRRGLPLLWHQYFGKNSQANSSNPPSTNTAPSVPKTTPANTATPPNSTGAAPTTQPKSNPFTGPPGSTSQTNKPDGTPKQLRRYGPDGYPETDVDYDSHGGQSNPHVHDWGRPADGSAPTAADRGHTDRPVTSQDPQPK